MNISNKKRNIGLDLARTTAILLVLFAHTLWISDHYPKVIEAAMRLSGTIGVEVFFIISGFLIGKIILREINAPDYSFQNVKTFLFRRWFRTFPNYYFLLLVNVGVWFFVYGELPEKLYKYFIYIQNFSEPSLPFYRVSWSLAVEQFSYIIGPVLMLLGVKFFPKKNRDALYLIVTIFIILCFTATKIHFYYNHTLTDIVDWNENIRKVLIYRLDVVYYGFLLRYVYNKRMELLLKYKMQLLWLGLFIIVILHIFRTFIGITVQDDPFFMIVLYLPLNSFAIACLIPHLTVMEIQSKIWSKFLTTISLISYSLYLLHYTIILHTMKVIFPSEALRGFELWAYTFLYWGITILLSYLLYVYFEKPVTDLRDSPKLKRLLGRN
ncbi:peptidoglycan/LPS O-acetylase OafA/YrhL [Ulvibacter sp. MAR_2010_11]|uniref:acyltransferase family protein n=1 Tax=Ulvibacter sp. MAR_2010_11 TaxID=1250229 RepID=UPI000C2B73C2|nr:acyltransferase [Ulvibacter sp. MAR_2010_11]PKA82059.1 peptidoglycan/LPS O-acetylase OafA/YrhL [Ulvibacter sp. MAR_2010_11]